MVRDSRPTVTSAALRRSRVNARAVLLVLEQLFLANVPEIPAEDQEQVSVRLETGGQRRHHPSRDVALRVKEKGGQDQVQPAHLSILLTRSLSVGPRFAPRCYDGAGERPHVGFSQSEDSGLGVLPDQKPLPS